MSNAKMYERQLTAHPIKPMNNIFHLPYLSTSLPAGILNIAEVNKKTDESTPAWNRDASKFLTTKMEYTGPRKPSPRDEKLIRVLIILIETFGNYHPIPAGGELF